MFLVGDRIILTNRRNRIAFQPFSMALQLVFLLVVHLPPVL